MALDAHTAADVRNPLIELKEQAGGATNAGAVPFLRGKPEETTMNTLSSPDGTTIAYDKQGEGPALILVDGALTVHSSGSGSELAKLLAPPVTVYGFDRRGRG